MVTRQEVYKAIDSERDYQEAKWGGHSHEVGAYITMLRTYISRADEAWTSNNGDDAALEMVRKVASIAVHCMEEHGAPLRK
jgi:hypothetical protein